jgi:hypothetical protein
VVIGIAARGDGPLAEFVRALDGVRSKEPPNHNYSVWFSDDPRAFQRLQWGGCTVVRTRDPNRFGLALALHLSGHGVPPQGLLRTDGVVAVRDGSAMVLPAVLRQRIPRFERPLREAGLLLSDAPWVDVDPRTGEVVLDPPPAAVDFAEVVARLPEARRAEPVAPPGRYRLTGWYFNASRKAPPGEMPAVEAVAAVLSSLRWPLKEETGPAAVARMLDHVPAARIASGTPGELLEGITR